MKKFILLFATLFIGITSFAQRSSEHLNFKGVPIDGTLNEYVAKMKSAEFKYLGEQDGTGRQGVNNNDFRRCSKKQNVLRFR